VINWSKLIKAALGLIVVLVLATMVYNWYGDFKAASLSAAASRPTTQTVDANASGITTGAAGTTYAVVKIDGVKLPSQADVAGQGDPRSEQGRDGHSPRQGRPVVSDQRQEGQDGLGHVELRSSPTQGQVASWCT